MRELGIARILIEKRRERGMTQDELAKHIGVSKSSVSKWETGQSYPDITFLPLLAAYFNISVDELLDYSPQMEKGDIRRLYRHLAGEFARRPFEEVMGELRGVVRKYRSCWPLLHQMAALIVNHHTLSGYPAARAELLKEAAELCARVRAESGDARLAHEAALLEAAIGLMRGDAKAVFDLVGEEMPLLASDGALIAQAHQMTGNAKKARAVLEIGAYQYLLLLVGAMTGLLTLSPDGARAEEIIRRTLAVAEAFELETLNSNVMAQFYLAAAQAHSARGDADAAMGMLARYAGLCGRFSFALHGDRFFDALDGWFEDFGLGADAPRNERLIRESMLAAVAQNPAFAPLADRSDFQNLIETLKSNIGG